MAKGKVRMKTRKAISKRFKVSGTGKLLHRKPGRRHKLIKKSSNRKRHLGMENVLEGKRAKVYGRLIGA